MRGVSHHLFQGGVHQAEQRAEPAGPVAGERGAAEVSAFDPGVQGVAAAVQHGDGPAVRVGDRWRDRQAEGAEPAGGPVLAGEGAEVSVEVVLEEVAPVGGGEEVAVVEQALGDGFARQRLLGAGVAAQQGSEGVPVGRGSRPGYR